MFVFACTLVKLNLVIWMLHINILYKYCWKTDITILPTCQLQIITLNWSRSHILFDLIFKINKLKVSQKMLFPLPFQFIVPLENFRKDHIGAVKERKKKFEKQTAKFCASQERYLGLSIKKQDTVLQEVRTIFIYFFLLCLCSFFLVSISIYILFFTESNYVFVIKRS